MKKTFFQWILGGALIVCGGFVCAAQEIIPIDGYSYEVYRQEVDKASYVIPPNARFTVARDDVDAPDIVYYVSKPKDVERYPIAFLCSGSSNRDSIGSIIHFHRLFLSPFLDLDVGVITLEQWGVDGNDVDADAFMEHYTRSVRLEDHCTVIEYLKNNPPAGWDGTFIFLGVSEGGPLVTTLTELYSDDTRATINWCGAGDWSWRDELWAFLVNMRRGFPWWMKALDRVSQWVPFVPKLPKDRVVYDACMDATIEDPCIDHEFLGMTHAYHADALITYPKHEYHNIKTPFLVVAGVQDSIIQSCDTFVHKAKDAGVDIKYLRIDDMDHYIGRRPEIIAQSFEWLQQQLKAWVP